MDRNFENSYANDSQRSLNYNSNDDLGQRQLNYDEESSFPDLSAMLEREVSQANDLRQQVDTEAAQSLTLLESKDKSYLYETPQFYLLWEWKPNNSSKQILALRKSPEQGAISLSNAKSQKWEDYFPNEISQAKIIVEASKNAPVRGQLSSELYGEIERLFSIDLSQVVFVRNSAKATQLKARAVTIGQEIHFAPNEWNEENESFITLLAHELAHIYQNKQNRVGATNMLGNQPINDDPRMEAEADQAAEATKKGRRFNFAKFKSGDNDLMKQFAQRKVAQRKAIKTNWGTFNTEKYDFLDFGNKGQKLEALISFTPDAAKVDATKINLVQTVERKRNSKNESLDPTSKARSAEGVNIDAVEYSSSPIYGSHIGGSKIITDKENGERKVSSTLESGFCYGNPKEVKPAKLYDTPTTEYVGTGETFSMEFETTALAIEGVQKDTYYGSVRWGFVSKDSKHIKTELALVAKGDVSQKFLNAAQQWNNSTTKGTYEINPADNKETCIGMAKSNKVSLPKGLKAQLIDIYKQNMVEIKILPNEDYPELDGLEVMVSNDDITDLQKLGGGKSNQKLPLLRVTLNEEKKIIFEDNSEALLPKGTVVEVSTIEAKNNIDGKAVTVINVPLTVNTDGLNAYDIAKLRAQQPRLADKKGKLSK